MRPLGHTEARTERDAHIDPLDERLQYAWKTYYQFISEEPRTIAPYHYAKLLLAFQPSIAALHALILRTECKSNIGDYMGIFVSAGYSLLPEKDIIYDLDTPAINNIGYRLTGKQLIIDGNTGHFTALGMIGSLIINGTALSAGGAMIGTIVNNGRVKESIGWQMFGSIDGKWNIKKDDRASFLRAIMNPRHLSSETLEARLRKRYQVHR